MMRRRLLLSAGLAIAGWLALSSDKTPANGIADPVQQPPRAAMRIPANPAARTPEKAHEADILALRPREELIGGASASDRAGSLFASQTWMQPPPPPAAPAPPSPPSAPPLPFAYLGKKIEDATWEVYLARGDQTHIVREQSVIDGMYRIESIKPPVLLMTYLPLGQVQTLAVGAAE